MGIFSSAWGGIKKGAGYVADKAKDLGGDVKAHPWEWASGTRPFFAGAEWLGKKDPLGTEALKKGQADAAASAGGLANQQRDYFNQAGDKAIGYFGQAQDAYDASRGTLSAPGYGEQLYKQRQTGGDPFFEYTNQRGQKSLDDAFAARGGFNSGAAIQAKTDLSANLGAQANHEMAGLAAEAAGEQRGRFADLFTRPYELGKSKADTSMGAAALGGGAYERGKMAEMEARLQRSGVDAETRKSILEGLFGIGAAAIRAG